MTSRSEGASFTHVTLPNTRCSRQRIACVLASLALLPSVAAELERFTARSVASRKSTDARTRGSAQ